MSSRKNLFLKVSCNLRLLSDNPNLMNIDVLFDNALTLGYHFFIAHNPLLCPCVMLDPMPSSTCILRKQRSVLSYINQNVRSLLDTMILSDYHLMSCHISLSSIPFSASINVNSVQILPAMHVRRLLTNARFVLTSR